MYILKVLSYSILLIVCLSGILKAQWIQTNGPYGGNVTCFAVSGSNIFAGTNIGGVYRSTDNGDHWSSVHSDMGDESYWTYQVQALTVLGSNIFAGTSHGVFRSPDNGTNWTEVNSGIINTNTSALISSGSDLFYANDDSVFYSTNNGDNWTVFRSGNPSYALYCLAAVDTNIFAGTPDGVYRFSKNAPSWTAVYDGLSGWNVYCLLVSGSNLFAGTEGGVSRSTDQGEHWTPVNTNLNYSYIYALAASGGYIYAADNYNGVFRTGNNGGSWTEVNTGLSNLHLNTLGVMDTYIFAGANGGDCIFRSTNDGANWTNSNVGVSNTIINCLVALPNESGGTDLFAGSYDGVFRSSDDGANWTQVNSGLTNDNVYTLATSGQQLFAGTYDGVFHSANHGTSWEKITSGLTDTTVYAITAAVKQTGDTCIFAGVYRKGVYRSDNNGSADWVEVNSGLSTKNINFLTVSDTNLFTGGSDILRCNVDSAKWTRSDSGITAHVYTIAASQNGAYLFAGTYSMGAYLSTNNGAYWSHIWSGLPGYPTIRSFAVSGTNTLAAVEEYGVYLTTNNGTRWTEANTGLAHPNVYTLLISGTTLYAGTHGGGVSKRPLAEMITSVDNQIDEIPNVYHLSQNYPNPFNPTTNFEFQIPNFGFVSLKVFDVLGREIASLVNEAKQPGTYTVQWDASDQPSGMYFYRLQAGSFLQTRKLLLLK
jgi:ligand-binding sensor domain-containing protein